MTTQSKAIASATKSFFVDMLVRDIGVDGAILDLIDNAVDAAYTHHRSDNGLDSATIDVTLDPDRFEITDNCGGIDIETAQNYAFRFGRAPGFNPATRIGEFGIGMKRAVFRLGSNFRVTSSAPETRFVVDVDVKEWKQDDDDWTFPMEIGAGQAEDPGTSVVVWNLHAGVSDLFKQDRYRSRMLREVADRYAEAIKSGLNVSLNKEPADQRIHTLLEGKGIRPEHQSEVLLSGGQEVFLRIIAGIGPDRHPTESGWYVYCNGRLVLKADRTELTGWGTVEPGARGVPVWHPQYGRFRGFVYFTSDAPAALPWTTTKTEIDVSSAVYRNALVKMRAVIRSYAAFTNELKAETSEFEDSSGETKRLILNAVVNARFKAASDVQIGKFQIPERSREVPTTPPSPQTTSIQFQAKVARVNALKSALNLRTNRQIGELAFERLYAEEIG